MLFKYLKVIRVIYFGTEEVYFARTLNVVNYGSCVKFMKLND